MISRNSLAAPLLGEANTASLPEFKKGGMPGFGKMPDMPSMPQLPSLGGPKIDIEWLQTKLEETQKAIYDITQGAIPQVNIQLPKLPPNAFGGSADGYEPVQQGPPAKRGKAKASAKASAKRKEAEKKAQEAATDAAKAAEEVKEQAVKTKEKIMDAAKLATASIGVSSTISLITAFGMAALASANAAFAVYGPYINAIVTVFITNIAVYKSHKAKMDNIHQLVNGMINKIKDKVTTVIDTVDDMILAPLNELNDEIDGMEEDQKPAVDKAKMLESTLQVDVPDPGDLRKPLDGAEDMIEEFVQKAKETVPAFFEQLLSSTTAGQMCSDKKRFDLYVVKLPVGGMTILNILVAIITVVVTVMVQTPPAVPAMPNVTLPTHDFLAPHLSSSSNLRGVTGAGHARAHDMSSSLNLTKVTDGHVENIKAYEDQIKSYILPTLIMIALSVVQLVVMMLATQGRRLVNMIN